MADALRKYNTALTGAKRIGRQHRKTGSSRFATGSDWTPAAGDVLVAIDHSTPVNITTLPTYTNGEWVYVLSAAETSGEHVMVIIADQDGPLIDDDFFVVETFADPAGRYPTDYFKGPIVVGTNGRVYASAFQRFLLAGNTLTAYNDDGSVQQTFTITSTAGADPVTGVS